MQTLSLRRYAAYVTLVASVLTISAFLKSPVPALGLTAAGLALGSVFIAALGVLVIHLAQANAPGSKRIVFGFCILGTIASFALPTSTRELHWRFTAGAKRGLDPGSFPASAWGQTLPCIELHAAETSSPPDQPFDCRAEADLRGFPRGPSHQVLMLFTQPPPENTTSMPAQAPYNWDGVELAVFAVQGGRRAELRRFRIESHLYPEQRAWRALRLQIPAGTERLEIEALPIGANWFDRAWLSFGSVEPNVFGLPTWVLDRIIGLAAGWLAGALVASARLLDSRACDWCLGSPDAAPAPGAREAGAAPWIGLGVALTIGATFGVVVIKDFAIGDDYSVLAHVRDASLLESVREMTLINGRVVGNALLYLPFSQVSSSAGLAWVRAASLLMVAGVAAALAAFLVRRGWPALHSAAAAVLLFTTPSLQIVVAWAAAMAAPFALAAAFLATGCLSRAASSRGWRWPLLAFAFQALALQCHQSWALFFVPFALGLLLITPAADRLARRRLLVLGATVFGATMGFAFLLTRIIAPPGGRLVLATDPIAKLDWFVRIPLFNAVAWSQLDPRLWLAVVVGGVVVAGTVTLHFAGDRAARNAVLLGVLLLPASYAANLASADFWPSYRSIGPLAATVLVLAIVGVRALLRFVFRRGSALAGIVLALVALFACVRAFQNIDTYLIRPQQTERALFARQLSRLTPGTTTHIHTVGATEEDGLTDLWRYDEFGMPSTFSPWVQPAMLDIVAREMSPQLHKCVRACRRTYGRELIEAAPHILQIDMRHLRELRRP
ncbi:MAG: hypothetical protein HZB38_16720 [Planctomycetes bacterium]|nr:hypothetical protein [Planctomycetota bacterium]